MNTTFILQRLLCILCSVIISLLYATPMLARDGEVNLAFVQKDAVWSEFRSVYPYHFQHLLVSTPQADGSRILIVSEPPPHASQEEMKRILATYSQDVHTEVMTHPVGHDGWVKDLVVTLPEQDEIDFKSMMEELTIYLFHTDYKYDFLPLDQLEKPQPTDGLNNLFISISELHQWIEFDEQFFPIDGGDTTDINRLLRRRDYGVYFSEQPGFVLWVLPQKSDLGDYAIEARQFALDSDLILGGMGDTHSMVIIGRERRVSTKLLPPLRSEIILSLASSMTRQLEQSYERNQAFAGKYEASKDWAPILLSEELKNQEFGSLLNITDQLLKSWSLNGEVSYDRFPYPDPQNWCFERAIMDELGLSSLTFNWNTKGSYYYMDYGYIEEGGNEYVGSTHSGALSVSYIANEQQMDRKVEPYEALAYECFANWDDPNLIRAVQYTSLYQIFRQFVPADPFASSPQEEIIPNGPLERETRKFIRQIMDWNEQKRIQMVERRAAELRKQHLIIPSQYEAQLKQILGELHDRFSSFEQSYEKDAFQKLIILCADRNNSRFLRLSGYQGDRVLEDNIMIMNYFQGNALYDKLSFVSNFLQTNQKRSEVKKQMLQYYAQSGKDSWIKTPSVVVSWADYKEGKISTGGHNIGTKKPEFQENDQIKPGDVQVLKTEDETVVLLNPQDINKINPVIVKAASREYSKNLIETTIRKELKKAPVIRSRNQAIPMNLAGANPIRRGFFPNREEEELLDQFRQLGYTGTNLFLIIKQFQRDNDLPITGHLDKASLALMQQRLALLQPMDVTSLRRLEEEILNPQIAMASKGGNLTFARSNFFTSDQDQISFQIGQYAFQAERRSIETALTGGNQSFFEEFTSFLDNHFSPDQIIDFHIDPHLQVPLKDQETVPILTDVISDPDAQFVNPFVLTTMLNQYSKTQIGATGSWTFAINYADFTLAQTNAADMPVVTKENTAGYMDRDIDYRHISNKNRMISLFQKNNISVYDETSSVIESENLIVITGHKNQNFIDIVNRLAMNGALKDKYVLLFSCYEKDEIGFNSALINLKNKGAKGILFFDEKISVTATRDVTEKMIEKMGYNTDYHLIDLFYDSVHESLEQQIQKKKSEEILKEYRKFFKGIIQFSFEPEEEAEDFG